MARRPGTHRPRPVHRSVDSSGVFTMDGNPPCLERDPTMSREPGEESPVATSPDADGEITSGRPAHDRPWPSTTGLARAMAMLSLGCSVLLLVLVVAFLVRNGIYVALGLGGVVLGV